MSVFAAVAVVSLTGAAQAGPAQNKELVIKAVAGVFIDHDPAVVDKYWSQKYIQHNPMFPNGRDVIKGFVSNTPPGFKYEMGAVVADGNIVMVRGRYTGFGPKPMIAVDMFRVEKGQDHRTLGRASGGGSSQPNQKAATRCSFRGM
ncbi:nuclear transport factor 2 family protein [Rhizobium beringeri]